MSLRRRLLIATSIAVLGALLVVDSVTFTMVRNAQLDQIDAVLQRAEAPLELLASTSDTQSWQAIPDVAPGLFVAIIRPDGTAAYTTPLRRPGEDSASVEVAAIDIGSRRQTVTGDDGNEVRLLVTQLADGSSLVVGESLHEANETTARLLIVLLAASGIAIVVVTLVARSLIRIGLRPLQEVEASAALISDQRLAAQRVPGGDQSTEVGSLSRTLNEMLDRLDDARVQREETVSELQASEARMRQFVADASHELRTPLAAVAAYAELFDKGAKDNPEDLERSMRGIRKETARMGELVADLLLLARLDEDRPLTMESVDLTELTLTAVEAARLLDPGRRFNTSITGVVTVEGDPTRLRQVVDNIFANVRSHVPEAAPCAVTLADDDGNVVLTISDSGPGVIDAQLDRLFDRFYRADDARARSSGGSGLGLSIAAAIVRAHGGSITARHNVPSGLQMIVRFPSP